jgi:murein DD-endopeptidase MepM/ murein hydrolase activator NlpD
MKAGRLAALALAVGLSACSQMTYDPGPGTIEPPPAPSSAPVATLGGQRYSVVAGDTIDQVARQFGVPVDVLIQANDLSSPFELHAGQVLVIPTSGSYVVAAGDSLYRIARQHGTTVAALAEANAIAPPYTIRVGQRLVLPGSAVDSGAPGQAEAMPPLTPGPSLPAAGPSKVTTESLAPPPGVSAVPVASGTSVPPPAPAASTTSTTTLTSLPPPPLPPVNPTAPPPGDAGATATALPPLPSAPAATAATTAPTGTTGTTTSSATTTASAPAQPQPVGHGSGKFLWPVNGKIVSPFGAKDGGAHNDGINIAAPLGTPVHAADSGVVVYAGNELRGFGNLLLLRHADGWVSAYAHCDAILVKRGEQVKRGQVIARVGQSGNVGAPQLHFELRKGAQAVDPLGELGPQGA